MPKRLRPGVKKPPRKMVVLTVEQDRYVVRYSKRKRISKSEAVRRIIEESMDYAALEKRCAE